MFNKIAVGGTFDKLHRGHKALLDKAFDSGKKVIVGISSDKMLEKKADPLKTRKRALVEYLKGRGRYELIVLRDPYGPTIFDPDIDAIAVSDETLPRAEEINGVRKKRGLKPLKIISIPMVLADDGRSISSSRIRIGEIDGEGRALKGMRV